MRLQFILYKFNEYKYADDDEDNDEDVDVFAFVEFTKDKM